VLLAPLAVPRVTAGRARAWLPGGGLAAGAAALAVTKFPADASGGWGSTVFSTAVWMMHLFGGAIWIGGYRVSGRIARSRAEPVRRSWRSGR
jgi:hypothetical protein